LGVAAWQAHKAAIDRDTARREAAREEAVRYNLTQLFRSAIADQGAKGATAKTMIDASAQRILKEYQGEPQLAGQIVLTLADLYSALEDVTGAESLLEGFVAEANPEADPAALADARSKLANMELLRGHPDRAQALLDQAEAYWSRSPQANLEERLEGLVVRARLQRARGDLTGSIDTTRRAIAQRIALSGHDHRETAILYNSLAISLAAANRLEEALAAYRETSAIYRALGLGDGLDAQIIMANTGTVELRNGHLREAQTLLQGAIDRERLLAGDSAAVAAAMGYYGKVLLITNRIAPAVEELHMAHDLAVRYAGATSPVALQNQLFLGEALLAAGDTGTARQNLTQAHDAALAQYGAAHLLSLRSELSLLQFDVSQRHYQDVALPLTSVVGRLKALGPQAEPVRAQALETLGTAYLGEQRYSDASAVLQEAIEIRVKTPADIWELALAQERLGEALAGMGQGSAVNMLKNAARDLESQLGAGHPETIRATSALARVQT
jgi:hypothetical protein